jgi:acyl carrier protein
VNINQEVAGILDQVLGLQGRSASFQPDTTLLGAIPELDSMAVVTILTHLEEHFGFTVEDDEISADTFSTLGTLAAFVEQKLG